MSNGPTNPTMTKAKALPVAFCTNCGALVPRDAKFCNACGESLTTAAAPELVQEPTERPKRGPWKRILLVSGLVVILGSAGTVGALKLTDHSADDARASLRASKAGVGQVIAQLHDARRLSALRRAGRLAQRREEALGDEAARLDPISDKDAGRKALATIGAERELLSAIALMQQLDPAHVAHWPEVRQRIEAASTRLDLAVSAMGSLGPPAALAPPSPALGAALEVDDRVVTHAKAKLRTWRRAYHRARRAQQRRLAAVATYSAAVTAQLANYNGLRDDLDSWISDVGDTTIPYGQAFDQLTTAADRRKDVRDALANLNPPHRLAAVHASLLAVLSDAILAMSDAGNAAQECTADPHCFGDDFRDTPQWRSFSEASRRITGQFGVANERWQQAVAQMRASVRHRRMPVAPSI